MAKSAFDVYPRETAVRLVTLMGWTGSLLLVSGFLGHITTFWAAGSIMILFAVGSWPKPAGAKPAATDFSDADEASRSSDTRDATPASSPAEEEVIDHADAIFESAKAQIKRLREDLARRRGETVDSG